MISLRQADKPLVFDIGANTGVKTDLFLQRGARVVCFEPQPDCIQCLRERFGRNRDVHIAPVALGAQEGVAMMSICSQAPTISTFSERWKQGRFKSYSWDKTIEVPVITLDSAIAQFGMPDYCKIDVEGFEISVLSGLSRQIPLVSFEFCSEGIAETEQCLIRLAQLGYSDFNMSLGENAQYHLNIEISSYALLDVIKQLPDPLAWGDVFAASSTVTEACKLLPCVARNSALNQDR
jgi:FkbM family methyltransferase